MKLKEKIFNQKQNNSNRRVIYSNKKSKPNFVALVYLLILFVTSLGGYIYGKVNTLETGYYYHNDKPYYLYQTCTKGISSCELYEYDVDGAPWSLSNNVSKIHGWENIGLEWNNTENIEIKKSYQDEDCYLQLHPPVARDGYYTYNNVTYYYRGGNWYRYVNVSWVLVSLPDNNVKLRPNNYYDSDSTDNDTYNFRYYYIESERSSSYGSSNSSSDYSSSSSNYDDDRLSSSSSDDLWDSSSSWDSGSTGWGSDW